MFEMLHRFNPDDVVLVHQHGKLRRWQFRELIQLQVTKLEQSGLVPGDRVLLALPNSLELMVSYYACLASGLVSVPVNDRLAPGEVFRIIGHCNPGLIISSPGLSRHFGFAESAPQCQLYLAEHLHKEIPESPLTGTADLVWPDQHPAVIYYTSGSTGEAKGVLYSHQTLRNNSRIYRQQFSLCAGDRSVLAHCMAHNFVFAQNTVPFLDAGGSVHITDFGNLEQTAAALESGAGFLSLIPWFGIALLEYCEKHQTRTDGLRVCLFGGDRVPSRIFRDCQRVFNIRLLLPG